MKFTKFDDWYDEAIKSGRITEEEVERGVEKARAATQGFRLRSLRKQLRLTQQQLADRINVSQSRISAIENGDIERMRVDVIVKYISALGGELQLNFALPNGKKLQERYPDPESEHAFIAEKAFRVEPPQARQPTAARFNPRANSLRNDAVGNTNIRIRNRAA